MRKIVQGAHHFRKNAFASDKELFEKLATGQNPDVLFITCADSRVSPNLLTNTKPGDLFVIRNAGNLVPPYDEDTSEAASIELAVAELGVTDVVVCGHSDCGAIKLMLNKEAQEELPKMAKWLEYTEATQKILDEKYSDLDGEDLVNAAIRENVVVQLENLMTYPMIRKGVEQGTIHLHGWKYIIETGEIFTYDEEKEEFVPLAEH